MTQPVTAAPMATRSIPAACSGTRIANGLPGSANGAELGADPGPDEAMSAATEATASRTSSRTMSLAASSQSSTTNRPREPSTWALATPGILRTGSSTTAAYSCQQGNGNNGSRSKCTRCPLCQRIGAVMPLEDPLEELFIPSTRPVESAADCSTGPPSSTTGLANSCTAPAAPAAVDTPARTAWAAPPVTPATTLATPGIFIRSPFDYVYRA